MATSPTVNKLQLGKLLKKYRIDAGLSQEQLGQKVFPHVSARAAQTKLASVEGGERSLAYQELKAIQELLGITDAAVLDKMDFMLKHSSQRGRWSGYRAIYGEWFRKYVDLEEDASSIRQVYAEFCPDLVQCEPYVRSLFAAATTEGVEASRFEDAVRARLARAGVITHERADGSPPASYRLVISESCLRRLVGNREVMREQMTHLIKLSKLPNIRLHIIPFSTPLGSYLSGLDRFSILRIPTPGIIGDLDFVFLPSNDDDVRYLDEKALVQRHEERFDDLINRAFPRDQSRRFLQEVEREYRLL